MKPLARKTVTIVSVITMLCIVMSFFVSDVYAQQRGARKDNQLVGHWTLVSVKNELEGKTTEPFGSKPKGLFIFDRTGRYVSMMFAPDLPKFASNNRLTGTPEENKAIIIGSLVHYGTYTVNEKEGTFSVLPEGSTFPNWTGIEQKRAFSISKDELKITNIGASAGGTATLILKRIK